MERLYWLRASQSTKRVLRRCQYASQRKHTISMHTTWPRAVIPDHRDPTASVAPAAKFTQPTSNLRPKVSMTALARFKAYQRSAIVKCLGQDWSARSKGASKTKTKPSAIGKVCAFNLVDAEASAEHFTQCTFVCHAPWCGETFLPSMPLHEFLAHEEEPAHAVWLGTQEYAYKCRFGCAMGFVSEHSRWLHEASQLCTHQPHDLEQAVVRCYNESKKKKCKDTNSKYDQDTPVDLNYYTVHYKSTHGREQYFNNPDSLKCHNCELGFTSRAVFARHLTGALKQTRDKNDQTPTINRLIFPHIKKLQELGLFWTVPQRYINTASLSGALQQSKDFSNDMVRQAYMNEGGRYHVIFFFCHSCKRPPSVTLEFQLDVVDDTMKFLTHTSRIHGNLSAVTISARHTKGKFMPSAFSDIALETTLVADDLSSKVYSIYQMKRLKRYAVQAAAATTQLTAQILHSFLQGKTPIVVSCGINGLCNNWPRLDAFASKLTRQYGGVDIVVRHTGEELDVEEEFTLAERICLEEHNDVYYGVYTTGDIADSGRGRLKDHGLLAWRQVRHSKKKSEIVKELVNIWRPRGSKKRNTTTCSSPPTTLHSYQNAPMYSHQQFFHRKRVN